jgi:hypothetical protein
LLKQAKVIGFVIQNAQGEYLQHSITWRPVKPEDAQVYDRDSFPTIRSDACGARKENRPKFIRAAYRENDITTTTGKLTSFDFFTGSENASKNFFTDCETVEVIAQ